MLGNPTHALTETGMLPPLGLIQRLQQPLTVVGPEEEIPEPLVFVLFTQ